MRMLTRSAHVHFHNTVHGYGMEEIRFVFEFFLNLIIHLGKKFKIRILIHSGFLPYVCVCVPIYVCVHVCFHNINVRSYLNRYTYIYIYI